jgi:glucose-1-phosphate cytidylyltransferase
MGATDLWINGGFFVLRNSIFDFMEEGEELVEQPFQRLVALGKLRARAHTGFWAAMDTFKDKIMLDRMEAQGRCPWMVWRGRD